MNLSTDQSCDPDRLSSTARRMLALQEEVFADWSDRVRASVKEAQPLPHPILINTFPSFYQNLAEAISPDHPRQTASDGATLAAEHGGERARLTGYRPEAVVAEFQQLRASIFDVLEKNSVQLTSNEAFVIHRSIDEGIGQSVSAFSMAQAALRERFVTALTHDLRNPLTVANVAAGLIMRSSDLEKIKELASRISSSLARADGMIHDLLDAVQFQTGEGFRLRLEALDMLEVAQEVREAFSLVYGPRFRVEGQTQVGYWDRRAIKRAIENLVGNAVKYGEPDTPVDIHIHAAHGRIAVMVHNEGEAIPPEEIESIFQVFRRAEAAKAGDKNGWGIGLPYVRSVAESHGGSVQVDSGSGRGITFCMDIPVDARPFQGAPTLGDG